MNRVGLVKSSVVCVLVGAAFASCTVGGLPATTREPGEGGDAGNGGLVDTQGGSDADGQAGDGNSGGKSSTGGDTGQVGGADGGVAGVSSLGGDSAGGVGGAVDPNAVTYDLKADWSNSNNPSGVWSLREGNNVITPIVQDWGGVQGQYAWSKTADGQGQVPALMKVLSPSDLSVARAEVDDVVVHPQDAAHGVGSGQARIVWTAPRSGKVDVKGAVWLARVTLKRADEYILTVGGVEKASGTINFDDGNTRNDPQAFSASLIPVTSGDEVVLQISEHLGCEGAASSSCAEFCGVLLTVKLTP